MPGAPIRIAFTRAPDAAWCEVDGRRFEVAGAPALYRLLTALNAAGYSGRAWTAHDDCRVCARGYVRDFRYDTKHGRPPDRAWYEANIGPWPATQDAEIRRADARQRVSELSRLPGVA